MPVEPLTPTTEIAVAEPSTGVLGTLGLNGSQFTGQLLNFTLVLLVMWYFVYRPLVKKMDERSQKIEEGLAFAKQATARLDEAIQEKDQIVHQARTEARAVIEEATAKAEVLRQEKMNQAKAEIEKVIVEAKEQIKQERTAAFDALKGDMANLVSAALTKIVKGLDEKTQSQMIAEAIREIEKT